MLLTGTLKTGGGSLFAGPTSTDVRDYMVGLQVLADLGLSRVRLLTNNPKKVDAFVYSGVGIEVVEQVPLVAPINPHNARYLATKRDRLGHDLPEDPVE